MAKFEWKNAELDDDEVDAGPVDEEDEDSEELSEDEEEDLSDSGSKKY